MRQADSRESIEIKPSLISGKGLFAKSLISRGSVVLLWRPKVLSRQEADRLPEDEKKHNLYPDGENMLWMQPPERYINHSCVPNTHVVRHSDVALRDIQPGEEITSDYLALETENFKCNCGSLECRNPVNDASPSPAKKVNHKHEQIELAKNLLKTVRHAAYATINEDGTPHNSPLMLIHDEGLTTLYIGSYSDSLHVKNLIRTGRAFAVLFDSYTKGQGGIYISGADAHECEGDELVEALRVHNTFRARHGGQPIGISYYQTLKPSQRMYSIRVAKLEIYSVVDGGDGLIAREARVEVDPKIFL